MIQVMASGICGTDLHIYRGEYMGKYPVIPGHEFAGVVTAVGSGVTRFQVGDRVACGGAECSFHAEYIGVPVETDGP